MKPRQNVRSADSRAQLGHSAIVSWLMVAVATHSTWSGPITSHAPDLRNVADDLRLCHPPMVGGSSHGVYCRRTDPSAIASGRNHPSD